MDYKTKPRQKVFEGRCLRASPLSHHMARNAWNMSHAGKVLFLCGDPLAGLRRRMRHLRGDFCGPCRA